MSCGVIRKQKYTDSTLLEPTEALKFEAVAGPFHLISTPPLWMMFLFLQSLRNNVALTPSEIPMDEFKNIAAPLEIPMISSETLQKSTVDEFVF